MRARVAFDTLAYANRLKAAGVEPKVAEAQAEINADMVAALLDGDLVSKSDLSLLKTELKSDISFLKSDLLQMESKLEHQIQELRSEVKCEISGLRSEMKTDMTELRSEFKQDMKDLETRLTLRLGGIMIGCITVASVILSMLHAVHLA